MVIASNRFSAAAYALGENPNNHNKFTDVVKTKLSNASTGGRFYEFVQTFENIGDPANSTTPANTPNWGMDTNFYTWANSYGWSRVWWSQYTRSLYNAALEDLGVILRGGDVGGSGSGGSGSGGNAEYMVFHGGTHYVKKSSSMNGVYSEFNANGHTETRYYTSFSQSMSEDSSVGKMADTVVVRVNKNINTTWFTTYTTEDYKFYLSINYSNSFGYMDCNLYAVPDDVQVDVQSEANTFHTTGSYFSRVAASDTTIHRLDLSSAVNYYDYSDGLLTVTGIASGNGSQSSTSSMTLTSTSSNRKIIYVLGDGGGSVLPPNNWPEGDGGGGTTTTPPDVPEPDDPDATGGTPPQLPNPQDPIVEPNVPSNPTEPTPTVPPTPTYPSLPTGTDYTAYLTQIIQLLRTINDNLVDGFYDLELALTNHCTHLQQRIHDEIAWLGGAVQRVVNNARLALQSWFQTGFTSYFLDELDYLLGQQIWELEDYLQDLFEWLAAQMQFNFEAYDDTSLMYWLRQIYRRLGSGGPSIGNGETVNPDDGFNWWEWLLNLISGAIGDIITDFVGDIGDFLDAVKDKFPFSIPWDLLALLSLLDAQRATPVITITIPAVSNWWQQFSFVLDFHPYDSAMATVRSMVLIWWAVVLVMRTDWLGKVFDGAAENVRGFVEGLVGGHA